MNGHNKDNGKKTQRKKKKNSEIVVNGFGYCTLRKHVHINKWQIEYKAQFHWPHNISFRFVDACAIWWKRKNEKKSFLSIFWENRRQLVFCFILAIKRNENLCIFFLVVFVDRWNIHSYIGYWNKLCGSVLCSICNSCISEIWAQPKLLFGVLISWCELNEKHICFRFFLFFFLFEFWNDIKNLLDLVIC